MSHSKLRKDKRCQNCGYFVAERFCPNCGQENVETRRRFHYLFVHFFEDFVHYDGMFWKNLKSLLFSPAKLTKEYLAGKRKSQVNPVQMFIFISCIAFFLPTILPDFNASPKKQHSLINTSEEFFDNEGVSMYGIKKVKTIEELDSIQQILPQEKKLSFWEYAFYKRVVAVNHIGTLKETLSESIIHNFPKAVFLYMPIFAFWLWLFHSKKKWLYFDHGIYTLHYFSFILLFILIRIIINWILSIFHKEIPDYITAAMFAYFIYYFFHSHRRMYMQRKAVSRLLCTALFFINNFCIIFFIVLYVIVIAWISIAI